MLLIACPFCGPRDEREFVYGDEAGLAPPDPATGDAAMGDAEWTAALYLRDDPRGPALEHWRHRFGCGRWLEVARDRTTHEIVGVTAARP